MAGFIIVTAKQANQILSKQRKPKAPVKRAVKPPKPEPKPEFTADDAISEMEELERNSVIGPQSIDKLLEYFRQRKSGYVHTANANAGGKRICLLCKQPILPQQEYVGEYHWKSAHFNCIPSETVEELSPITVHVRAGLKLAPIDPPAPEPLPVVKEEPKHRFVRLEDVPTASRDQILSLLDQGRSVEWLADFYDATPAVIEQILDIATNPSTCQKCKGSGYYTYQGNRKPTKCEACDPNKKPLPESFSLKEAVKVTEQRDIRPAPKPEPEPEKVTLKILAPANAGEKKSEVVETRVEAEPPIMPEPQKRKPKAFLSRTSQQERFKLNCLRSRNGEHWHYRGWKHSEPMFSVDGKPMPVTYAAYVLFHGEIPSGYTPIRKCGIFNCVKPDCMTVIRSEFARALKKPRPEDIREIKRLTDRGLTVEEVVAVLQGKIDPKTVTLVSKDLKHFNVG